VSAALDALVEFEGQFLDLTILLDAFDQALQPVSEAVRGIGVVDPDGHLVVSVKDVFRGNGADIKSPSLAP